MIWLRHGVVYLLSLVFFVSLMAGVFATSANVALAHPDKLEAWLNQSGLYSSFVNMAIKEAKASTGDSSGSGGITLSDVAVQQAAQAAFSPALLQQAVNSFLNSNYAWLEGQTSKPSFVIDLTTAKQTFAQQVGQYITTHLTSLPICTPAQARAIQTIDPLTITCRPASLNAAAEGSKITQQIISGSGLLSSPVITADNINQGSGSNAQAYYRQFSFAPKLYQWALKLPLVMAGLALLSALGIILTSSKKRRGWRWVGIILTVAGAILLAIRFAANIALQHIEAQAFNNSTTGDLQQSLTNFFRLVESQIVKINLYFGGAFLALALVIFIILLATHGRGGQAKPAKPQTPAAIDDSATSITSTTPPTPTATVSTSATPPIPLKRPRIIQ